MNVNREKEVEMNCCVETLRRILYDLGFKYLRRDGRIYVLEDPYIAAQRKTYLKKMKEAMDKDIPLVFLDETWIFQYGSSKSDDWRDGNIRSCQLRKLTTGSRIIICHAVCKEGWIQGAGLHLDTGKKAKDGDDYHNEMNADTFEKWGKEQLISNLPADKQYWIIMDNASYHSRLLDKCPNKNALKKEYQEWLTMRGVPFDAKATNAV